MPVYVYTAIKSDGKKTTGSINSDNERTARQALRNQNLFPTDIKESTAAAQQKSKDVTKYFQSEHLSLPELSATTRQLSTLLTAGMPVISAIEALTEQSESHVMKRVFVGIKESVEEGLSFSKALGKFPKSFPSIYINMVASGEASGTLDSVLMRLADYFESQLALRSKARSALIYPVLMLIICSLVIMLLFVFVVPNIVEIFIKQGATLPLPTQIMITISNFLINYWWLVGVMGVLTPLGILRYYRTPDGRSRIDQLLLKLPLFGPIYIKTSIARITQTLGAMLESGVPILQALDIAKKITNNVHLVAALEKTRDGVQEGHSLAAELRSTEMFPPVICHMISVGEKSGALEEMLTRAGVAYETDVKNSVESLTSLLNPLLMLVVGLVVLGIVFSILLPMADLINVVQGA